MTPEQMVASGAMSVLTGAVGVAGALMRGRSTARAAAREADTREAAHLEQLRRAEARIAELEQERLWLRDLSLGGIRGAAPPGRPRRRDLSSLAALVRGLSSVEEACIADADGLVHSEVGTTRGADLAVFGGLVIAAERRLSAEMGGLVEARVVLGDASHVTARPLRGWAEGFAVVASAVSRAPNPAALNAVVSSVAMASSGRIALPRPNSVPARRVTAAGAAPLLEELSRLGSGDAGFVSFQGRDDAATWTDGRAELAPSAEALAAIDAFASQAAHVLRAPSTLRVDFVLGGRSTLTWASSLDGSARVIVATRGRDVDDAALARLFGRAARLPSGPRATPAGAEAA